MPRFEEEARGGRCLEARERRLRRDLELSLWVPTAKAVAVAVAVAAAAIEGMGAERGLGFT